MRVERGVEIERTPRVIQLEGLFDVPPQKRQQRVWEFDFTPDDGWQIGLILGPSGSGKSTLLDERYGIPEPFAWSDRAVVDDFPAEMPIRDVTGALSAVGFSAPPAWLRPFRTLSNGEQFRATLARAMCEPADPIIVDEFTSVVDRTVAKIGSAAVAKWVRRTDRHFVAASCHYDIVDWLQPDWVYDVGAMLFSARHLQPRPPVELEIYRTTRDAWSLFHQHHYLSADLAVGADCHVALIDGAPAAFVATIPFPHPRVKHARRLSRLVTLPDYQGIGVGNVLGELVGSVWRARGHRFYITAAHPAAVRHFARSSLWRMTRKTGLIVPAGRTSSLRWQQATQRWTASFEYVGPPAAPEHVAAL